MISPHLQCRSIKIKLLNSWNIYKLLAEVLVEQLAEVLAEVLAVR